MSGVFGGQKLIKKKQFNDKCGIIIMINSPTPSLSLFHWLLKYSPSLRLKTRKNHNMNKNDFHM